MKREEIIIFENFAEFENYINEIKDRTSENFNDENNLIWADCLGTNFDKKPNLKTKQEYIDYIKNIAKETSTKLNTISDILFLFKPAIKEGITGLTTLKVSYILYIKEFRD